MRFLPVFVFMLAFALPSPGQESKQLMLAMDGTAQYDIVLGGNPATQAEQFALLELREHLNRAIGAEREGGKRFSSSFIPEGKERKPRNIHVGWTGFAKSHGVDFAVLEPEEWIIRAVGDDILIVGGRPRGTLYGVYEFLERFAGTVWPERDATFIPLDPNLSIPADTDLRGRPQIRNRGTNRRYYPFLLTPDQQYAEFLWKVRNRENQPNDTTTSPSLPPFHQQYDPANALDPGHFTAQNAPLIDWHRSYDLWSGARFGFWKRTDNPMHNVFKLVPPEKWQESKPEFFAMRDGEWMRKLSSSNAHRGDLNYANTESRQIAADALKKEIAAAHASNDIFGEPRQDVFFLTQMDNNDFSQDPASKDLLKQYGQPSGVLLDYVNDVAGNVAGDYPDVKIKTFAYIWSMNPPNGIRAADNVIVQWCNWYGGPYETPDLADSLTHPNNALRAESLRQWGALSKQIGIWDYHYFPTNFPYAGVGRIAADFPLYSEVGVDLAFIQMEEDKGATEGPWAQRESFMALSRWLTLQLMSRPNADAKELTRRFLRAYYGAGADAMGKALDHMLVAQALPRARRATLKPMHLHYMTPEYYAILDGHFAAAEAALSAHPAESLRVRRERVLLDHSLLMFWEELAAKLTEGMDMPFDYTTVLDRFVRNGEAVISGTLNATVQAAPRRNLDQKAAYYRKRTWPEATGAASARDRVDIPAWKFNPTSNWFLRDSRVFENDPDSSAGRAETYFGGELKTLKESMSLGFVGSRQQTTIPLTGLLNHGYRWIPLGRVNLSTTNQIWVLDGNFRFDLDYPAPREGPENNMFDVFVSLKLTGSGNKPERLSVDRIVLRHQSPGGSQ